MTTPEQPFLSYDPPPSRPGDPLEESALDFHRRNPHVMQVILRLCQRVRDRGVRHWSIAAAFEVARYQSWMQTDGKTYKLNNNHRAFYARWIMRDFEAFEGFFSTRDEPRVEQSTGE